MSLQAENASLKQQLVGSARDRATQVDTGHVHAAGTAVTWPLLFFLPAMFPSHTELHTCGCTFACSRLLQLRWTRRTGRQRRRPRAGGYTAQPLVLRRLHRHLIWLISYGYSFAESGCQIRGCRCATLHPSL